MPRGRSATAPAQKIPLVREARFQESGTGAAALERSASLLPAPCARRLRGECRWLRRLLPESAPRVPVPTSLPGQWWRATGARGSGCTEEEGSACDAALWDAQSVQRREFSRGLFAYGIHGCCPVGQVETQEASSRQLRSQRETPGRSAAVTAHGKHGDGDRPRSLRRQVTGRRANVSGEYGGGSTWPHPAR
jgi:hypothetical protein